MTSAEIPQYKQSLLKYETVKNASINEINQRLTHYSKDGKDLPPIESIPSVDFMLRAVFPPKVLEGENEDNEGQTRTIEIVSNKKASREDVINLQSQLDSNLEERQARESGICPIREELHNQCFDEIIRQVIVDCPERGLLLMKVRDELKMTIAAYQTLYKSAVAFGMRKQIQADKGKEGLEDSIRALEQRKQELLDKVILAGLILEN